MDEERNVMVIGDRFRYMEEDIAHEISEERGMILTINDKKCLL